MLRSFLGLVSFFFFFFFLQQAQVMDKVRERFADGAGGVDWIGIGINIELLSIVAPVCFGFSYVFVDRAARGWLLPLGAHRWLHVILLATP